MDIPCKMRGNVQEITFLRANLAEFCYTLYNSYKCKFFLKQGYLWRFHPYNFCLCSCRWRWRSTGFVPNGCAISCWARSVCSFFAWAGLKGAAVLILLACINWLGGLWLGRLAHKKPLLAVLVLLDLAVLGGFKYAGFAAESINAVVPGLLPVLSPALPLGISFYVFTAIGYCVDVAVGRAEPEKSPFKFAVFLAFFGHGLSGPIVRYNQQAPQLDPRSEARKVDLDRFSYGIKRLILGLAKKAIIADQLALIYAKVASVPAATLPAPILILGYTAYMMQLYFDFSGYSDMAIGIGEFFGITLPENFDYPYLACSIGEYWRRWHMSLSGWFRDYVYIPLGGSRCRLRRTCLNLLIVFTLTGLWHGAAWQYVVFGLLHGLILCAERLGLRRALERLPRFFGHLYTVMVLWLTLVIFGAPGLKEGLAALWGIFTWQSGAKGYTLAAFADAKLLLILAVSFLLCGPLQALRPKLKEALYARKAPSLAGAAGLLVLLFFGLMRVTAGTYSAFIYFQF